MSFNVIYLKFEKIMGTYFVNFASWMQTSPFLDVNELQQFVSTFLWTPSNTY